MKNGHFICPLCGHKQLDRKQCEKCLLVFEEFENADELEISVVENADQTQEHNMPDATLFGTATGDLDTLGNQVEASLLLKTCEEGDLQGVMTALKRGVPVDTEDSGG